MVRQQDAERGQRQRHIADLLDRAVLEHQVAVRGHQQEGRRRVVLEAHAAGPFQPGGALAERPVRRDLQEMRLQRVDAVQIGLDPRQVGGVLRGGWAVPEPGRPAGPSRARAGRGGAGRVGSWVACGVREGGCQAAGRYNGKVDRRGSPSHKGTLVPLFRCHHASPAGPARWPASTVQGLLSPPATRRDPPPG